MPTVIDSTVTHFQACIDACSKCMQACEECLTSCLKEPDVQARQHCISMLRDCADICSMAALWMSRGSMHAKQLCQLCATICDACAADCAKFQDAHCKACADACRKCAEECRRMAA
ncbi:four-helix bundle copper-binding protein [Paenibacillus antri]|uniref:Four-helix bundle copper-binding protein n=1 Tax=Paenibacillus antri TaxID=2582848 RepID=A0A5R9G9C7_9BACL|nr:four-helix bundle copper-binding protein [Paenibacillus antri]TLS49988.1 four-helix bundle copper-binding protein [Paenibacillus antri]